jgi:S-adenosylmethionine synthetase
MHSYTAESVTEGHPDKICDQISDQILDEILKQDLAARVAVETLVTTGLVHVVGEVTTEAYVEIPQVVRAKLVEIGYNLAYQLEDAICHPMRIAVLGEVGQEIFFIEPRHAQNVTEQDTPPAP